jgi:hypothetical protein
MLVAEWTAAAKIRIGHDELEECDEFRYLDSTIITPMEVVTEKL